MLQPKKKLSPIKSGYKAILFDCDGTLVESSINSLPSSKVTDAIKNISSQIHVGIATQRSIFYAAPILKQLKLSGPSIIDGGARVIDSQSFEVLREELIEIDDLTEVIEIIKKFKKKYHLSFFLQDGEGRDKEWTEEYIPVKPIVGFIPNIEEEVADELKTELSKISNISVHKVAPWGGQFGIVIGSSLATKQHGIFEVAKILGIKTHEIIGVGDSYNDFPLLMLAG